jgi:hypothetical protein
MKRRKGWLYYVLTALLALVCIPITVFVAGMLSVAYDNIPTPGIYVAVLLIQRLIHPGELVNWVIPQILIAGIVNLLCCYAVIRVLAAAVRRYIEENRPPGPSGQQ